MSNLLEFEERARAEGMLLGYLEIVCASMTLDEYESGRLELGSHLVELSAAYEELGLAPLDAMRAAVTKLGPPKTLGLAIAGQGDKQLRAPSLWLAVLVGGAVSSAGMSAADVMICRWGIVSNTSGPLMSLIGMAMGLAAATFVVRCRWSQPFIFLVSGLLYGPGLLTFVLLLNGGGRSQLVAVGSILFGLAGLATAGATALAMAAFRRSSSTPIPI